MKRLYFEDNLLLPVDLDKTKVRRSIDKRSSYVSNDPSHEAFEVEI